MAEPRHRQISDLEVLRVLIKLGRASYLVRSICMEIQRSALDDPARQKEVFSNLALVESGETLASNGEPGFDRTPMSKCLSALESMKSLDSELLGPTEIAWLIAQTSLRIALMVTARAGSIGGAVGQSDVHMSQIKALHFENPTRNLFQWISEGFNMGSSSCAAAYLLGQRSYVISALLESRKAGVESVDAWNCVSTELFRLNTLINDSVDSKKVWALVEEGPHAKFRSSCELSLSSEDILATHFQLEVDSQQAPTAAIRAQMIRSAPVVPPRQR